MLLGVSEDLLSALSSEEREALLAAGHELSFTKGSCISQEGSKKRALLFVLSGEAAVLKHDRAGREVMFTILKKGSCIGETSLLLGEPRSADVVARSKVLALELSHRAFLNHSRRYHGLGDQLLLLLARRLRDTSQKVAEFAFLDVPSRVLSTLRSIATRRADDPKELLRCVLPKHHELAAMIGSSREMVSRALSLLEESGEIRRTDGYAIIRR